MPNYLVALPIEIDGKVYGFGEVVQLDDAHAAAYSHALRLIEDEAKGEKDGSNG